jgi:putative ABC transport system ATP-binding protein
MTTIPWPQFQMKEVGTMPEGHTTGDYASNTNGSVATPVARRDNRVSQGPRTRNEPDGQSVAILTDVRKSFNTAAGPFQALRGVSLRIDPGEFVAITGRSGSGKSTLINMLTGIDRPTSGELLVCGEELQTLNENSLALWRGQNLGIIFQFFQLLPTLSVLDNVMLPMDFAGKYRASERSEKAMALLEMVDLTEHAHKLPAGLSGGQQQRAAIARALANDPPLLVADEPTGNLDSKTAESVFSLFERLTSEGKTILMVTHDEGLARRTGRHIVLSDGQIIDAHAAGDHGENLATEQAGGSHV